MASTAPSTVPVPSGEGLGTRWADFHARTAERAPRPLLLKACGLLGPGAGRAAVDLGSGSGADALALAERGWAVTAIDRDPAALAALSTRLPSGAAHRVAAVQATFAGVAVPRAHLVHAGYSLPFCDPADFPGVWAKVRAALLPGGVFAGQFLGPRDGWAESHAMTFHDAREVEKLLDGLEVLHLQEKEWDGQAGGEPEAVARARRDGAAAAVGCRTITPVAGGDLTSPRSWACRASRGSQRDTACTDLCSRRPPPTAPRRPGDRASASRRR